MILGFITQFFQSKRVKKFEQIISENIKKTPFRIRQELRTLVQEFIIFNKTKAGKEFDYIPRKISRTSSCPDLDIYRNLNSPTMVRKRALSECPGYYNLQASESQSDLEQEQNEFLLKVVDALANLSDSEEGGYDNLPDSEILASEKYGSRWSLKSQTLALPKSQRRRAISDIRVPSMHKVEARQDVSWYDRPRTFSEPATDEPQTFFSRIKNFISPKDHSHDVERNQRRASMFTTSEDRYLRQTSRGRVSVLSTEEQDAFLEKTSIADFIRALSAITVPETMLPQSSAPKRKLGTASLSPPKGPSPPRARRLAIRPNQPRRNSLMPDIHVQNEKRRYSLRPVEETLRPVEETPPPYTPMPEARTPRRFSRPLLNVPAVVVTPSPVQRQVNKRDNKNE